MQPSAPPRRGRKREPLPADGNPVLIELAQSIRALADRYQLGTRELAELSKSNSTLWSKAWRAQTVPNWRYFEVLLAQLRFLHPNDEGLQDDLWRSRWEPAKAEIDEIKKAARAVTRRLEKIELDQAVVPDIVVQGGSVFVRTGSENEGDEVKDERVSSVESLVAFVAESNGSLKEWIARIESEPDTDIATGGSVSTELALARLSQNADDERARAIRERVKRSREDRVEALAEKIASGAAVSLAEVQQEIVQDFRYIRRHSMVEALLPVGAVVVIGALITIAALYLASEYLLAGQADNNSPGATRLTDLPISATGPQRTQIYPGPPAVVDMIFGVPSTSGTRVEISFPPTADARHLRSGLFLSGSKSCDRESAVSWELAGDGSSLSSGVLSADRTVDDPRRLDVYVPAGTSKLSMIFKSIRPQVQCIQEVHLANAHIS